MSVKQLPAVGETVTIRHTSGGNGNLSITKGREVVLIEAVYKCGAIRTPAGDMFTVTLNSKADSKWITTG